VSLAAMMRPNAGYIKLDGFSEGTAEELEGAIKKLQATSDTPLRAIVLDLRDNPGGLLDAAVAVSQQLVPQGTDIVSTSGRVYGEGTSLTYRSVKAPLVAASTRLVMLVNGNTASAAEIVTGAVQDTDRGVVVGERTFGKGLVQVVEPLPGGASLKLTVAKYYTPSGRCIQAISYSPPPSGKASKVLSDKRSESSPDATTPLDDDESDGDGDRAFQRTTQQGKPVTDSKLYTTLHGRQVKGGGGIAPDMRVEAKPLGELERSLFQRGVFFQFASIWLEGHKGSPQAQEKMLVSGQEEAYREFVRFAKDRVLDKDATAAVQDLRLARQLKTLEAELGGSAMDRSRSAKELKVLMEVLVKEELAQFTTQKDAILQDMREAVLGRLTSPSARLLSILGSDPQVTAALDLAEDLQKYSAILDPPVLFPPDTGPSAST